MSLPPPPVREFEAPRDPVSDAALQRYKQRQRRPRIVYAAVITVVVLILGVLTVVAWSSGETNNSTLRTVADPPANLPIASSATSLTRTWQASSRAAIGVPQWRGTVVVFGGHTVQGNDARTGKTTWSYTRSDRSICTAAQLGGVTVAVYKLRGNCDQVAGLDSQTGQRRWSRTLDMDGMPVTGVPTFLTSLQGGFSTLFVRTRSVIYALDPASGYNRWTYTRYGCEILGLAAGSSGALISQNCSNQVRCATQDFCKPGRQLLLRNAYDARDDKSDKNPDKITWNLIGTGARPVSADTLVSAIAAGTLLHLDARNGTTTARTTLSAEPDATTAISATDASGTAIVSIGTTVYALRPGEPTPVWSRNGRGPATVLAATASTTPVLTSARITVLTAEGAATLDGPTGRITGTVALPDSSATATVYPLGAGFLTASTSATAAYA